MANEFNWSVRVYYEDTDAGGVVFYANYLKFMERARTEWLRDMGYEQDTMMQRDGIIFAVRKLVISYLRPAYFNELLNVRTRVIKSTKVSLLFEQNVINQADVTICEAECKIVSIDSHNMKIKAMPDSLLAEAT